MTIPSLTGRLVRAATATAHRRFVRAAGDPAAAQRALVEELIRDASRCAYGRHFGLRPGDREACFRSKLPPATYEDLRPWIERAVFREERGVLSRHAVVRVETTSGSSSGVKWIPYTAPMMKTFNRMFTLWAHDLLASVYRPGTGKLFLCVTGGGADDGTVPRQLAGDDRDYLGRHWRRVLDRFVVVPQFARSDQPVARLAAALEAEPGLEVMSFWSPALLVAALDHLGVGGPGDTRRLWPRLQLISCWTAASSALFTDRLAALFPGVRIQGKGLLATEAAVTIPLEQAGGCVPLLNDVYLEFIAGGQVHRLHELEDGGEYEVLVSNRAGLLRYRLGDRVRVDGRFGATPRLEFIGRAGIVSDLVGEKLSLEFVAEVLGPAIGGYFCLIPDGAGYQLWIEARHRSAARPERLDELLCGSFHYGRARRFGQLAPVEVREVEGLAEKVRRCLEGDGARSGSRAFKPPLLVADREKARRLSQAMPRRPAGRTG